MEQDYFFHDLSPAAIDRSIHEREDKRSIELEPKKIPRNSEIARVKHGAYSGAELEVRLG